MDSELMTLLNDFLSAKRACVEAYETLQTSQRTMQQAHAAAQSYRAELVQALAVPTTLTWWQRVKFIVWGNL